MPVYRILFCDRDFPTASPGVYAILCLCKERLCQESTLRGLRREVRFIMSPPGKRRHNELNAAPPPETPRGTGKPGEPNNRDVVHSGESFCIRGKTCFLGEPHGTTPTLASPRGLRSRGAVLNWFPVGTKTRSSACGTATDTSRSETAPPAGGDEV